MDALRKPPVRKLNPGMLQSDDEVREQFVVRKHEFASVLEVLRGNIEAPSCQHVLVVAPRGRGKTMLLARVAAELHTDAVLSERPVAGPVHGGEPGGLQSGRLLA